MSDMRKLMETAKQLDEGRVEDFAMRLEQMWIQKLEQQIVRYAMNNEKGSEWAEGAEFVLQKVKSRNDLS